MRTGTRRHRRAIILGAGMARVSTILCAGLLMLRGLRGATDVPAVEAAHTPGQTATVCHGFVVLPTGVAVLSGIPAVPERAPALPNELAAVEDYVRRHARAAQTVGAIS